MPFTFSHPAIVLPLAYVPGKRFSLTGLIIGSMVPDFEYFLRMRVESHYSHTLPGLFWFDLPLGLLLAFVFHTIVRDRLFNNLPIALRSRFAVFRQFDWNRYAKKNLLVVIISVLIGALSHIIWDSFTHDHGYFVQVIPALSYSVDFFSMQVPVLKILQHSSTLGGALIIALTIYRLPAAKTETKNTDLSYWVIFAVITILIIAVRFLTGLDLKQYGNVIVTGISAALFSLILTSLLIKENKTGRVS